MAHVYKSVSTIEVNQAETTQLLSSLSSNSLSNLPSLYSFLSFGGQLPSK